MVVLHPRAGFQRTTGQLGSDAQDASALVEERLQLGLLGGKRESVDQRMELCILAWRVEGGKTYSRRGSKFVNKEDYPA